MHIYIYIYAYMHIYIHTYIYMYVYIYTYDILIMCTWCYIIWRIRWVLCQFRHPLALEDPHIIWLQAKDRVGQRIWKKKH